MDKKEILKALFVLIDYGIANECSGFDMEVNAPDGKVYCKFDFEIELEEND